jgi:hypothetical protein
MKIKTDHQQSPEFLLECKRRAGITRSKHQENVQ